VSTEGWTEYAEYARRLDAVRAEEVARTAGMREGVAAMSEHADTLQARLNGQGGMLLNLAGELRLRRPKLTPIPPEGFIEPATALGDVGRSIDLGDAEARRAADRGQFAALLPNLSAGMRGFVVYGAAALVILLFQGVSFARSGQHTNAVIVLFLIPLIGFVIGYAVLALGSRTRMVTAAGGVHARWGFVLCFAVGPAALLVVLATSVQSS
jgi:hypothetical protein